MSVGEQALEFLRKYRPAPWFLSFGKQGPNIHKRYEDVDADQLVRDVNEYQSTEHNCWFRVAYADNLSGASGSMSDADVLRVCLFPVDIDRPKDILEPAAIADWKQRVLHILGSGTTVPVPSVITSSGNGIQAFYVLKERQEFNATFTADDYSAIVHGLARRLLAAGLPADPKVRNPSRLMRIPVGKNFKAKLDTGAYPTAGVLAESDRLYEIAQLLGLADHTYKTLAKMDTSQASVAAPELWRTYPHIHASPDVLLRMSRGPQPGDPPEWADESRLIFHIVKQLVLHGNKDRHIKKALLLEGSWTKEHLIDKDNPEREIRRKLSDCRKHDDAWVGEWNQQFAIIQDYGGKAKVTYVNEATGSRNFMDIAAFHQGRQHKTQVILDRSGNAKVRRMSDVWVEHAAARRYKQVTFAPGKRLASDMLNSWQGFTVRPKQGDWSLFKDHVYNCLCGGVQEYYDFLLKWMAFAVQHPGRLPGSAVVIVGGEGTGKGTFAEIFGSLFGRFFRIIQNSEHVTGAFNADLQETCVLYLNESVYSGNRQEAAILKGLITDPFITINPKGVNKFSAPNNLHVIISTNDMHAIRASADARRFFCLRISQDHAEDSQYFGAIREQMDNGGCAAMLYDLKAIDLTGFKSAHVPRTKELAMQKSYTLDPIGQLFQELLFVGEMPGGWKAATDKAPDAPYDCVRVSPSGLIAWLNGHKDSHVRKFNRFFIAEALKRYFDIAPSRKGDSRFYQFPSLSVTRQKFQELTGTINDWPSAVPNEQRVGVRFDNTEWECCRNEFSTDDMSNDVL